MKPIKLLISGFGPYGEKMPEIDFRQFEEKGLFLISGDTGAGKTTIFDAICFALYGTTSGTYRDTKNLRSEYAGEGVESYVDFYFSHQGKEYHVKRRPAYERPKKRGTGVTPESERAVFQEQGQPPIEGVKQVNNAVEELLHINDKQFKQIAMIAQGEFWELLNAKTEQRTEILRTIFMTDPYKNIEYKLKDRMNRSFGIKNTAENSIIQYFGDAVAEKEEESAEKCSLAQELSELQERAREAGSAWNIDEMLELLDRINAADTIRYKEEKEILTEAEKELKERQASLATAKTNNDFIARWKGLQGQHQELEDRREEIKALKERLAQQKAATREVYPVYASWKAKEQDVCQTREQIRSKTEKLEAAGEKAQQCKSELEKMQQKRPEAEELQKRADKIKDQEAKYQQRDQLLSVLTKLQQDQTQQEQDEAALKQQEQELAGQIRTWKDQINTDKEAPAELTQARNEGEKLDELQNEIADIMEQQLPALEEARKSLSKKQDMFLAARQEYDEAHEQREEAERILENCRAGILAENLKDGEKCPVCGSTHHPEPAKLPEESVTEEVFKKLQKREEELQQKKQSANTEAEKAKTMLQGTEEQLWKQSVKCLKNPLLDIQPEEDTEAMMRQLCDAQDIVEGKNKENRQKQEALAKTCTELEKLQQSLEKAQGEKTEQLREAGEQLTRNRQKTMAAVSETTATLKTMEELPFDDWEMAEAEMKKMLRTVTDITDAITQAEQTKKQADDEVTSLQSALTTQQETLRDQQADEKEWKEKMELAVKEQKFTSVEEMLSYKTDESAISDTEEIVRTYEQDVKTNQVQLEQAQKDAAGKEYIDMDMLEGICREKAEGVELLRRHVNAVENRIRINKEKHDNIAAQKEMLEKAGKEYDHCRTLYNLVKGMTGNGKITLEQYIQAAGFDGIIAAANRRLLPMSDGQYELYRQDTVGKKSNNFLDLEVLDNYTGHRRPVGNLSGGESFKASLSLALGLSDTVSSNLGGIQMDALFVDEGFGTLDRKSMDNALECLMGLSDANKLVGIISHREELMENIPQQIKVKKTKEGSRITIENGI